MEPHGLAREGGRRGQGLVRLCSCVARRTSAIAMKRGWLTTRASVIVTFSLLAQSAVFFSHELVVFFNGGFIFVSDYVRM